MLISRSSLLAAIAYSMAVDRAGRGGYFDICGLL